MVVYAIKLPNDKYYAGCNKQDAQTLLGAQLYRSEKTAKTTMDKSINFHEDPNRCRLVKVNLEEIDDYYKGAQEEY